MRNSRAKTSEFGVASAFFRSNSLPAILSKMSLEDTSTFQQQKQFAASMLRARVDQAAFVSSGSLQKLTQLCILKNMKFFCDLEFYEKRNPFMRISNTMKNELMELDAKMQEESLNNCKDAELQIKILQLLLNQKITSFQFPPCLHSENLAATSQVGQMLLDLAPPDLHTISVCTKSTCPSWDNNWGVRPFFERLLPAAFPNLQVLRLENFECNDQDLEEIAEHLPTLRVLELDTMHNVSKVGVLALMKLTSLEEFCFCISYYRSVDVLVKDFLRPCLQLLPHLHALAIKPTRPFFWRALSIGVGNALTSIKEPCVLQLRRLTLEKFYRFIPEHVSLPELQALFLVDTLLQVQPLSPNKVPNLSELHLRSINEYDLLLIVGQIGQQLQALSFTVDGRELRLDRMLDVCPNLTELEISSRLSPTLCASPLKPDTLQQLQKLSLYFSYLDNLQSGLLLQFLRLAPELRSVNLRLAMLDNDDLKGLAELAEQQICMAKLEHFHMLGVDPQLLSEQSRRLLDQAINSCSINCPNLQNFSVSTK